MKSLVPPPPADTLAWAIEYAQHGWRVVPLHSVDARGVCSCGDGVRCTRPGKHPLAAVLDGVSWTTGGTDDVDVLRQLWDRARAPWTHGRRGRTISPGVGVATGPESGVWVLDFDLRPEQGLDGSAVLRGIAAGREYETAAQRTGGGGWQLIYSWTDEWALGDRTIPSRTNVLPGVDVRGLGGLAVLPPSPHRSGRRYEWVVGHGPADFEVAPAPDWLLDIVAVPTSGRAGVGTPPAAREGYGSTQPATDAAPEPLSAAKFDRILEALACVSPCCDRDTWLRVGMALHSTGWPIAFEVYEYWSSRCPSKYHPDGTRYTWNSFAGRESSRGVTLGTLFHLARSREGSA